ncbi:DUF3885 domain-containing protein [Thalassotalea ponticola]|uniref:DUF3885 domain-containing protein n=1 Tax=Thalassotalea ponticola TaxID=1523392 RepID=UPI0025B4864C|nr:DUF3885 domain-containing protein [Thalassotalea ponticola]MDN3652526.1 DUF3885 domain-containing protein [Thalassotalea ponticola]
MDITDIKLEKPLFYNNSIGLRFEIGPDDVELWDNVEERDINKEYFDIALQRAISIFNEVFKPDDSISIVFQMFSDGRRKVKKNSFIFKQFLPSGKPQISYTEHKDIYSENIDYKRECWKRATFENITPQDVNIEQILLSLINFDFPSRRPSSKGEVYFINHTRDIVLNLYDDRGMDVIALDKAVLMPLYLSHNQFILNYDRAIIEQTFGQPT